MKMCSCWCHKIGIDWKSNHFIVPKLCMLQCNGNSRQQRLPMPAKLLMWTAIPMGMATNCMSISSVAMGPTMPITSLKICSISTPKGMGWRARMIAIWHLPSPNPLKYTESSSVIMWVCPGVGAVAISKACKFKSKCKGHSNGLQSIPSLGCQMQQTQPISPKSTNATYWKLDSGKTDISALLSSTLFDNFSPFNN